MHMNTKEIISRYDFRKTVDMLEEAIETSGLKVVSKIDAQENLRKIDVQITGNTILEVFHPRLAREVFEKDLRAGIVPPVRIYIFEKDGRTFVITQNVTKQFAAYKDLTDLGKKVNEMLTRIAETVK